MCFVNMGIENVVSSIVEAMLPRFSDDKTVLVMSLDLRVRNKKNYEKPAISRVVHLMFHRPDNYTKALWNTTTNHVDRYDRFLEWKLKCDHDSCWSSDGVSSPFFKLAQEMMQDIRPRVHGCPAVEVTVRFHQNPKLIQLKSYRLDAKERIFKVEYIPKARKG